MNAKQLGTVTKWIPIKNYGFVSLDAGGDAFVHRGVLPPPYDDLVVGQQVMVLVVPSDRGPRAEAVELLDK